MRELSREDHHQMVLQAAVLVLEADASHSSACTAQHVCCAVQHGTGRGQPAAVFSYGLTDCAACGVGG